MPSRSCITVGRWLSIASLSVVGAVLAKFLIVAANPVTKSVVEEVVSLGTASLIVLITIVLIAALVPFAKDRCCGFLGLRYFFAYPPLWLAVLIGSLLLVCLEHWLKSQAYGLDSLTRIDAQALLWLALCVLLSFAMATIISFMRDQCSQQPKYTAGNAIQSRDIVDAKTLYEWLDKDDKPINVPEEDMFNHRQFAKRIARRLTEKLPDGKPAAPTFVLFGPLGIGKTSIYNLLQYYLEPHKAQYRCVRLSAWKYSDRDSLIRGVLSTVIDEVHSIVDAHSLAGLPLSYVATISATQGFVSSLSTMLASIRHDPTVAIDRISNILSAIDVVVIVWIDDLDRFRHGGDVEPVRALLELFRESSHITFVMAESAEFP